jgi:[histone H4]-N-methyl-L-lysine20 N-methyltransferase
VCLTSKKEAKLRDHFSIVKQTKNKVTLLFLSLARFVNYNCTANAKLILVGCTNIEVKASCNILISKEIFVLYSNYYFDKGNYNCLCKTCEDAQQNK